MCFKVQRDKFLVDSFGSFPKLQCVLFVIKCVSYLTVESEDPVTMTLSSYCRHNTEPVWPVSIFRHSRDCLSQIYKGKKQKYDKRKIRKNKGVWKYCRFGSCKEWPILTAAFMHSSCPISPLLHWALCAYVRAIQLFPGCALASSRTIRREIHCSLPPILTLSSSPFSLLLGQTDKWNTRSVWSWAFLSYNSLLFSLSVCWFSTLS